jgi:hypothetical protein
MNHIGLLEVAGIIVVLALIAWPIVFFQVVVTVPLFLLVESGLPFRWEGQIPTISTGG